MGHELARATLAAPALRPHAEGRKCHLVSLKEVAVTSTAEDRAELVLISHVDDRRSRTDTSLAWEWTASLLTPASLSREVAQQPIGSALGYLVDLRSGGRRAQRELDSLTSDTESMAAVLAATDGALGEVRAPHTPDIALLIEHLTLAPPHRGHGLGPHFAARVIAALTYARSTIPVLLVPRPDGWAEMPQAQVRDAQAKVERSWRTLGFSPYQADHGVWWAPSTAVVRQLRK